MLAEYCWSLLKKGDPATDCLFSAGSMQAEGHAGSGPHKRGPTATSLTTDVGSETVSQDGDSSAKVRDLFAFSYMLLLVRGPRVFSGVQADCHPDLLN